MILQTDSFGGHTYHLIADVGGDRISWSDAEAYALTLGGHLVTVDDAAENAFLLSTFAPTAVAQAIAKGHQGFYITSLWLGLNDVATEGNFVWLSGASVTYTNWSAGEPQSYEGNVEDYAGLLAGNNWGTQGAWHDIYTYDHDFNVSFGVVELQTTSTPEPASMALLGLASLGGIGLRWRQRRKTQVAQASA